MLHHLAGVTIQVANLVNYDCHPQLMKRKPMTSVTSDFSNEHLQNNINQNIYKERYIVGFIATVIQYTTLLLLI